MSVFSVPDVSDKSATKKTSQTINEEKNKSLTRKKGEQPRKRIEELKDYELPNRVKKIVDSYEDLENHRNTFIWKWTHSLVPHFTFSSVQNQHMIDVRDIKTISTLFTTLLDDLIDKNKDKKTFEEASKIPFPHQKPVLSREGVNKKYLEFTEQVWNHIIEELRGSPRFNEFKEVFFYDIKQVINSIDYTHMISKNPEAINLNELEIYDSHNMMAYPYTMIDLFYSPEFNVNELSDLREIVWKAQKMGRIGNWVSTWEREFKEKDYESGITAYALDKNLITLIELKQLKNNEIDPEEVIEKLKKQSIEEHFHKEWKHQYKEINKLKNQVNSIDMDEYLKGLQKVLEYHISSKGMK